MGTKFGVKNRSSAPFAQYDANKRNIASRTSSVTIYYYHWTKENFGTSTNVQSSSTQSFNIAASERYVTGRIEGDIENCTISKNIEHPSATFNFTLFPTKNWKRELSPGDWILVYFNSSITEDAEFGLDSPTSTKNLVLIGNIDRIARVIQKDEESDTTTLRYQISGRNFGKVFEQTDIWYDPYSIQVKTLDVALRTSGLEIVGSPDEQVNLLLDTFLGEGGQFNDKRTTPLKQWFLPRGILSLFGSSSANGYFNDILEREIKEDLPGYKPRSMLTPESNGSLWEVIKRSCNDLVNEVYLEEVRKSDGSVVPMIVMKPRPFQTPFFNARASSDSQFGSEDFKIRSALKGAYKSLQEYSKESYVEILQSEIIYENLGRDDHSRINMLFFNTTLNRQYILSPSSNLGSANTISNPVFTRPSIMRHGLRRMDALLEYCHSERDSVSGASSNNIELFKAFATQLYDMNYVNHLYEQGTIECTGVLEAELGKVLVVKGKNTEPKKIYFIEGYEHKWQYPNLWTTIFTVSKGQFRHDGLENPLNIFIDVSKDDFGFPDSGLDFTYIAKTDAKGRR
jgi:hypothetical protein